MTQRLDASSSTACLNSWCFALFPDAFSLPVHGSLASLGDWVSAACLSIAEPRIVVRKWQMLREKMLMECMKQCFAALTRLASALIPLVPAVKTAPQSYKEVTV